MATPPARAAPDLQACTKAVHAHPACVARVCVAGRAGDAQVFQCRCWLADTAATSFVFPALSCSAVHRAAAPGAVLAGRRVAEPSRKGGTAPLGDRLSESAVWWLVSSSASAACDPNAVPNLSARSLVRRRACLLACLLACCVSEPHASSSCSADLRGAGGVSHFKLQFVRWPLESLPCAHTCDNRIDLPACAL